MTPAASFTPRTPRWMDAVLSWVYPEVCQLCHEEAAGPSCGYVGPRCQARVQHLQSPFCNRCGLPFPGAITHTFTCGNCSERDLAFESARAAVLAEGPVLDAIHRYKYSGARWFQTFLGRLLLEAAVPELVNQNWSMVVPVPLHPVKERERGFNQATALALPLATALGIPMRTNLIHRAEPTHTQTTLSRGDRAANVDHAFRAGSNRRHPFPWSAVAQPERIDGANVVVVDDVLTTGATADSVARQLKRLGADRVCVWSVARATLD